MSEIERIIETKVLDVAKRVEAELDNELEKLEKLDLDDLETIREKRLQDIKKAHQEKQDWISKGHGEYYELKEEKEFFELSKKSPNMVIHFFKADSPRCKIVDHHLKILCTKHFEARFIAINVEKAPFLTDRLGVRVIPTIILVKDSIADKQNKIVGFTDLGNCDDFSTEMLEWRIAQSGAIKYSGDLTNPPDEKKAPRRGIMFEPKKTIRNGASAADDDSDDDFFEKELS